MKEMMIMVFKRMYTTVHICIDRYVYIYRVLSAKWIQTSKVTVDLLQRFKSFECVLSVKRLTKRMSHFHSYQLNRPILKAFEVV